MEDAKLTSSDRMIKFIGIVIMIIIALVIIDYATKNKKEDVEVNVNENVNRKNDKEYYEIYENYIYIISCFYDIVYSICIFK